MNMKKEKGIQCLQILMEYYLGFKGKIMKQKNPASYSLDL